MGGLGTWLDPMPQGLGITRGFLGCLDSCWQLSELGPGLQARLGGSAARPCRRRGGGGAPWNALGLGEIDRLGPPARCPLVSFLVGRVPPVDHMPHPRKGALNLLGLGVLANLLRRVREYQKP